MCMVARTWFRGLNVKLTKASKTVSEKGQSFLREGREHFNQAERKIVMEEKIFSLPTKRIVVFSFLLCLGTEVASFFIDLNIMFDLNIVIAIICFAIELFVIRLRFDPEFKSLKGAREIVVSTLLDFFRYLALCSSKMGEIYLLLALINLVNICICLFLPVSFLFYFLLIAVLIAPEKFFTKIVPKVVFSVGVIGVMLTTVAYIYHFLMGTTFSEFVVWVQSLDLFKVYKMLPAGKSLL